MSIAQQQYIIEREVDLKKKRGLLYKLDIAEAINFAYIGSQPAQKHKVNRGLQSYQRWRRKIYREIDPELFKPVFLWDKLKKSKRIN